MTLFEEKAGAGALNRLLDEKLGPCNRLPGISADTDAVEFPVFPAGQRGH